MSNKKGLGRIISALLAASSLVGQASAAARRRPADKVKVDKNVVRRDRKKKARSAELDVGGRERRDRAINAYTSPLDNPRNWVDAVLGVSTLGFGGAALYYYSKASKNPQAVSDFVSRAHRVGGNEAKFCDNLLRVGDEKGFLNLWAGMGDEVKFFVVNDNGKVTATEPVSYEKKCYYSVLGIYGEPVYRTLGSDVGAFVDYLLVKVLIELGNMSGLLASSKSITFDVLNGTSTENASNLKDDKCITSLRKHLWNMCDKFLNTSGIIAGNTDDEKNKNLALAKAEIARIFDGAEAFEEALRSKFSGFAEKYEKEIHKPKEII